MSGQIDLSGIAFVNFINTLAKLLLCRPEPSNIIEALQKRLEAQYEGTDRFLLLSLKRTRQCATSEPSDLAVWWGPNSSGYTMDLLSAGIYSAEEIRSKGDQLNDGINVLPIPVSLLNADAATVVQWEKIRPLVERLLAEREVAA